MEVTEELYTTYKPLLFALAYRLLGTVVDAEDIVQETFITLANSENEIYNVKAYLCKVTTNRCLDYLKSARRKREMYLGPWLPEPLLLEENDPVMAIVEKENLSMAYLKMIQQLSVDERVVLLLREALAFEYQEIAEMIDKSEHACRKLLSRAKQKLTDSTSMGATSSKGDASSKGATSPTGDESSASESNVLVLRFLQALEAGDTAQLVELLDGEITLYSDGGGQVRAAVKPIYGRQRVLGFFFGIAQKLPEDFSYALKNINGQLGIVNYQGGALLNTITFQVQGAKIREIYLVLNPDKLKHLPHKT